MHRRTCDRFSYYKVENRHLNLVTLLQEILELTVSEELKKVSVQFYKKLFASFVVRVDNFHANVFINKLLMCDLRSLGREHCSTSVRNSFRSKMLLFLCVCYLALFIYVIKVEHLKINQSANTLAFGTVIIYVSQILSLKCEKKKDCYKTCVILRPRSFTKNWGRTLLFPRSEA